MAEPLTPPADPPANDPGRDDPPPRNVRCGFCGCSLTRRGEVLTLGAEAKAFRALEDERDRALAEVEAARARLADAEAKIADLAARVEAAGKRRGEPIMQGDW